jgi:hypothetical protein
MDISSFFIIRNLSQWPWADIKPKNRTVLRQEDAAECETREQRPARVAAAHETLPGEQHRDAEREPVDLRVVIRRDVVEVADRCVLREREHAEQHRDAGPRREPPGAETQDAMDHRAQRERLRNSRC